MTMNMSYFNPMEMNTCLILGKLADPSEAIIPNLGLTREAITQHHSNDTKLIYIQPISREPKAITGYLGKDPKSVYILFDNTNPAFLRSINYSNAEDKIQHLHDHLQNKLILFKPRLRERRGEGLDQYHFNLDVVWVGDQLDAQYYLPVPRVDRDLSSQRLDTALQTKRPFRMKSYPNLMDTPEFIICENHLYHIPKQEVIISENIRTTYYCTSSDEIQKIRIPDDWDDMTRAVHDDLMYISDLYALDLRDRFAKHGQPLGHKDSVVVPLSVIIPEPVPISPEPASSATEPEPTLAIRNTDEIEEYDFLNKLLYLAHKESLVYEEADLYNFHVALKTNFITVLGGMSGTGKTKLAMLYAKALGLKNGDNLLVLAVSPAYSEPSDILGYLNQQLGIYMESETGLVSFLQRAEEQPDRLFMVIFDEMNLGQVEHYFSPFISLLEMDDDNRFLTLFSDTAMCRDKKTKSKIQIGKNIMFVGTANFDETTKDFSKRLLDRANVIHLQKYKFQDANAKIKEFSGPALDWEGSINSNMFCKKWTSESQGLHGLEYEEMDLLDKLHEKLRNIDAQTGVSFRIFRGIGDYLANIPKDENRDAMLQREHAFDYQVRQRILTKIRGHREQIESLVGTYDFQKNEYVYGDIAQLFKEEGWDFRYSIDYLTQKAKELTRNGYTF
ncbi:AAA family ATPase [Paenibacillus sp. GYB004]|uniref:McrB family protein n=1 Tax=Paenibacillus sp. GYB004 TaxID=2994393 RepID=UPI002F964CC6